MNHETQKPRVLIVDDIVVNLKLLRQILKEDYLISFAPNGHKALDIIGMQRPDLILLDVMMPEMDGIEVCRRLKLDPETSQIPIIFITANEEVLDAIQTFIEKGKVDYIIKPVESSILFEKIQTLLK